MADKLRVAFDEPEHGWIGLSIEQGNQSVRIDASTLWDSIERLVAALHGPLVSRGEFIVTWQQEPAITELHFVKDDEQVSLRIYEFTDEVSRRNEVSPSLQISGSPLEIVLPFWRALRALEGRFSREELEQRIQNEFPSEQLAKLTCQVELAKAQA